mmetsp:Transcript_14645/g.29644  ORF Transcript_14645/g.29644 Transcript_14645/m.29644 type:complete len:487 (-) Transcript_14645:141-1601(-)
MLTDTVVDVAASVGLSEGGLASEVSTSRNVVLVGTVEVGRTGDDIREDLGDVVEGGGTGDTGGLSNLRVTSRDLSEHLLNGRGLASNSVLELLSKSRVLALPLGVSGLPVVVDLLQLIGPLGEELASLRGDVELLIRKAKLGTGLIGELDTGFTVGSVGTGNLVDTFTDNGAAHEQLRLAVVVGLGVLDGGIHSLQIMSINDNSIPSHSLVTLDDILGLGELSHLVKGDIVRIVQDNEVVKLLVGSESSGLEGNTFLKAAITSKSEDVVVDDRVLVGVVSGGGHLLSSSHTNSVGNTLSERTSGGFNSRGGVLGVRELRVARGHGVVLTELLELIDRKVVTSKVKPRVDEHGSVSSGEDEAVTVDPLRVLRVVSHGLAPENSTDLSSTKRKTKVSRVGSSHTVHGETTFFVSSLGESSQLGFGDGGRRSHSRRNVALGGGSNLHLLAGWANTSHGEALDGSRDPGHGGLELTGLGVADCNESNRAR